MFKNDLKVKDTHADDNNSVNDAFGNWKCKELKGMRGNEQDIWARFKLPNIANVYTFILKKNCQKMSLFFHIVIFILTFTLLVKYH